MYSRVEFEAFSRFEISNREAKLAVADRIAAAAESGQTIGAGSGSTAFLAVHALSTRVKAGELEDIRLVPTSYEIEMTIAGLGLVGIIALIVKGLRALGDIAMVAVLAAVGVGGACAWLAAGAACLKWWIVG